MEQVLVTLGTMAVQTLSQHPVESATCAGVSGLVLHFLSKRRLGG